MAYFGSVTITNKFGWSKTVEFHKALLTIGRSRTCDVVLEEEQGAGAEALHLQLVCPKTGDSVYRVINLAGQPLEMTGGPSAGTLVKPRTPQILRSGDVLVLGEFTLAFDLQTERGVCIERRSANLGMKLELPHAHLRPDKKLAGVLTLTNYGATRRCQFTLEADGLPVDCMRISPAPLLYPGASEEVEIQFFHRGIRPPAGRQTVRLFASASQAYPQEMISISLDLLVEAFHKYSLAFDAEEQVVPTQIPVPQAAAAVAGQPAAALRPTGEPPISAALPAAEPEPQTPSTGSPGETVAQTERVEPAPVQAVPAEPAVSPAAVMQPEPVPAVETAGDLPEQQAAAALPPEPPPPDDDDQDWWSGQPAARSPQRAAEPISGSRKNIRTMLAGKDIHVIKAGEDDLPDDPSAAGAQQNGSAA